MATQRPPLWNKVLTVVKTTQRSCTAGLYQVTHQLISFNIFIEIAASTKSENIESDDTELFRK